MSSGQPVPFQARGRGGGPSSPAVDLTIQTLPREDLSGGGERQDGKAGAPRAQRGRADACRDTGLSRLQTLHSCPPQAAEQTEPSYVNLELQTWPLSGKPVQPMWAEVEYSTVVSARAQSPSCGPQSVAEASPRGVRQVGRGERLDWSPCASEGRGDTENQSSAGYVSGGPAAKTGLPMQGVQV